MLADLKCDKKVVGTKETLKAIKKDRVLKVYLATNIDEEIKNKILQVTINSDIPIEYIDSKLKLGRACGVDVATASAALLK